jgi:hypothetical protein
MLSDLISTYGERLIIAVVGVGLAFIALIAVLWLVKRRGGPAPFLKGGRNRQPRLQVLDATAVDARRRLVLVRRDNVEHLIMIGGPTDIVVESGIGAIPFVTDISEREQDLLSDLKSEPTTQKEAVISAPAPVIAATRVERDPSTAPAAPITDPKPAKPLDQQSATEVSSPVNSSARQEAPSVNIAVDQPKASSPVMTSAMRPRSAPTQSQTTEAIPVQAPTPLVRPKPLPPPSVTPKPIVASSGMPASATIAAAPVVTSANEGQVHTAKLDPVMSNSVDDIFAAARERVLPDLAAADKPVAASAPIDDSFSSELRNDFESFLNAEIEKSADVKANTPINHPAQTLGTVAPITGATVDADAQKEMARIFGEMSVKRD